MLYIKKIEIKDHHIISIHRTQTQVLSHNKVLSTTWASTFPHQSIPH